MHNTTSMFIMPEKVKYFNQIKYYTNSKQKPNKPIYLITSVAY